MTRVPLAVSLLFILFILPAEAGIADNWHHLATQVRDGKIAKAKARAELIELHQQLLATYGDQSSDETFVFPVQGYGAKAIEGVRGEGFQPKGYSFYDGNRHGGHPAHDIFIHDRNFDCRDDRTGQEVTIVSCCSGVVLSVNPSWTYPSDIRGGIYVWLFAPQQKRYYYYAHLASATVKPGDWLTAGQAIGTLGRTGKNAWPRRSPTHLHFMALDFANGAMVPYNTYPDLIRATTSP
ncbi:MAG TPA: M23 family metallopeptidase [Geobacterales bacterium]|nr:M23 family metallopeptidase [Geobacterales bacterium]